MLNNDSQMKHRTQEITKIVNQMKELSELMSEFSKIVVEQGTVMDQIDYYVYNAKKGTRHAVDNIKKTKERESSKRSQYCITCLVQSIMVCIAFIAFKHM